jgi:hypothetical protein
MKTLSQFGLGVVAVAVTLACNNAARPTIAAPVTVVITHPPNGFRANAGKPVRVAAAVQHGTASDVTFVVNGRPAAMVRKPPYETVLVAPMDRPMRLIARAQVGGRSVSSKELYIIVDPAPPRPEAAIITNEETAEDISGPMIGRTGPAVALTAPTNGQWFAAGATVNFRATASTTEGSIAKVEFLDGEIVLGESRGTPYTYSWTNPTRGTHKVTARATDDSGAARRSPTATITVGHTATSTSR